MKPFDYSRTKPYKFYTFIRPVGTFLFYTLFNSRVIGKENIPKSASGIILCSNHLHSIDPVFFTSATKLRWRFIAKIELFNTKFTTWFYTHCNAIPVDRDKIDRAALDCAVAALEEGSCGLGVFPEGHRSKDGRPQEGKNGIAMLARKTKADILPCSIYHDGPLKFRTKLTIRIGELIPFAELGMGESPNAKQSRAATAKIMAAVTELWAKGHGD